MRQADSTQPTGAVRQTDVAVVIVTYNSAHVVGDLLDSLPAALGSLIADVVVVDNDSQDGTAELVANRGIRVVHSANVGYAAGINVGVRVAAPAEAILVLNPDVQLGEGCVPRLRSALRQPGVGIAAPRILSPDGTLQLSLRREPTLLRVIGLATTKLPWLTEVISSATRYGRPGAADWALGAALLVSRECHDILGGWDESFFLYAEEMDLALRARDHGLALQYEPTAVVVHIGGQSGRNDATHVMHVVNRIRLFRRRNGAVASWCFYLLTLANEVRWTLRGHRESRSAVAALLSPTRRPAVLGCSARRMPT
jgi:N-acetylglucosaminyl-diphospho-decaprenol L-rhamnosyltransferase